MDKCFGLKNEKCNVLIGSPRCEGCVFYKTKEEKAESDAKTKKRCRELGIPYGQEYIDAHSGKR
jgi:hypothetical protein